MQIKILHFRTRLPQQLRNIILRKGLRMEHLIFKTVKINISIINLRQLTMIKIIMILSKFQA